MSHAFGEMTRVILFYILGQFSSPKNLSGGFFIFFSNMATFSLPRFPENSIASFEGSRPPNPHSPNLEVNHGDETADLEPEERFFECVEFFEDSRPISPMTQNGMQEIQTFKKGDLLIMAS